MTALRNYTDTKNELEIAKIRLECLLERKEELYLRYFSTTNKLNETKVIASPKNDNMIEYIYHLTKVNPVTGLSLEKEIEEQQNAVNKLRYYINLMNHNLESMKSIEYKLYYAIVVDARGITDGIEYISEETGKDASTIWKIYYPKIKLEIEKLKYF